MQRYYYLCDDLDELEAVEKELEQDGFPHRNIHVLSENDASVSKHHLHELPSLLRRDTLWYAGGGLLAGALLGVLILLISGFTGLTSQVGAGPVFMATALLTLFCCWEGGLIGFQTFNHRLRRFRHALRRGQHLLLVDIPAHHIRRLQQHTLAHPKLSPAGHDSTLLHGLI